jgi:single-strand DNA-binding protein
MNKCSFVGRITRDADIRYTDGATQTCIAKFGLAINRRFKRDGEPEADFINCVAFGKTAEIIEKYVTKGSQIGIVGRVQTGSYTNKDGVKVYTTDFVVEELDLLGKKENTESTAQNKPQIADDGFMNIPDGIDEELPFN